MKKENKKTNILQDIVKIVSNKNLFIVLLISILNSLAQFAAKTPVNVYGKSLGLSMTVLGGITTLMGIAKMVTRPFSGYGADHLPVKKWVTICCLIRGATFLVYAMTNSVAGFVLGRFLEGISFALIGTAMYTIISTSVDKKALGTAIAVFVTVPKLFQMIMPTVAMILYKNKGESAPYWVAVICMVLSVLLTQFLKFNDERRNKKENSKPKGLSDLIAFEGLWFLPLMWANSAIVAVEDLLVVVYATSLGYPISGGLYFSFKNALTLALNVPIGALADKIGEKYVICFGFLSKAIAFFLLAFFPSEWIFSIAGAIVAIGQPMQNVMQAKAIKIMPSSKAGIASSTHLLLIDIGVMIVSPIAGYISERFGYSQAFIISGCVAALGILAYALLYKRLDRMEAESIAEDKETEQ